MEPGEPNYFEDNKVLAAEIGLVVIAFEALLKGVREEIYFLVSADSAYSVDYHYVDILLHDSMARSLTNYLRAVSHYSLDKNFLDQGYDLTEVDKFRKVMRKVCDHIDYAAEFRNDIVHSSYDLYALEDFAPNLTAVRSKVTKDGIEERSFRIFDGAANVFFVEVEKTLTILREASNSIRGKEDLSKADELLERVSRLDFKNLRDDYYDHVKTSTQKRRDLEAFLKNALERFPNPPDYLG